MIHSMSGGVITEYDRLTYVFAEIAEGRDKGVKRWFISPTSKIKPGDRVVVDAGVQECEALVLRVESVTAQTAPFPVNRTREIIKKL